MLEMPTKIFLQLAAEKKTSLSVGMSYIFRPSLLILSELYQHTELFLKNHRFTITGTSVDSLTKINCVLKF